MHTQQVAAPDQKSEQQCYHAKLRQQARLRQACAGRDAWRACSTPWQLYHSGAISGNLNKRWGPPTPSTSLMYGLCEEAWQRHQSNQSNQSKQSKQSIRAIRAINRSNQSEQSERRQSAPLIDSWKRSSTQHTSFLPGAQRTAHLI